MWGLCLDRNAIQEGLFQTVIQYEMTENGEVLIILPETVYKPNIQCIRELLISPKYSYGDQVSPCNHPDITGIICGIHWHFKLNCFIYKLNINGNVKSRRYYDEDLNSTI